MSCTCSHCAATACLTHWAGFIRDASGRLRAVERAPEGLPVWLREDRVSGLSSRAWFDELLVREWRIARREAQPLTLVLFDVDALGIYNDTFGRAAGDACVRRIARVISGAFRRGTDIVARWDEGSIAVLAVHRNGTPASGVAGYVETTSRRIADMHVHHPHSPVQKFVTVTAGLGHCFTGAGRGFAAAAGRRRGVSPADSQGRESWWGVCQPAGEMSASMPTDGVIEILRLARAHAPHFRDRIYVPALVHAQVESQVQVLSAFDEHGAGDAGFLESQLCRRYAAT